jgi:hypothetical protein
MNKILIALLIGLTAGIIDIIPMIIQKIDKYSCASALVQWIVLGFVIAHVQMQIPNWAKGSLIAVLACLPIVILVAANDVKSIPPIIIMSLVLGAAVGFATGKFAS